MTPGDLIGHYRIVRKPGEGGMGQVYLAEDTHLHRQVALKALPESLRATRSDIFSLRYEAITRGATTQAPQNRRSAG